MKASENKNARKPGRPPKTSPTPGKDAAEEFTRENQTGESAPRLQVDFKGYPELYERLEEHAKSEIRPPEMQILHMIKSMV